MKVLYAIQGTGNGHLSRARAIIPVLQKHKIDLDLLVSGTQADVSLPYPIKYQLKGLSFIFGKKGGVDIWKTLTKTNPYRLYKEIKRLPVEQYNLVINDFEPISAWASKLKKTPCVSFSHQAAVIDKNAPKPKTKDRIGSLILNKYAPTEKQFGLHFENYSKEIYAPIIRNEIREATPSNKGHYTVYLPAYSNSKILEVLSRFPKTQWQVFSKHCTTQSTHNNHIHISPINNQAFVDSMVTCEGMLCGAGFETPAEILYLGKKLLTIPMSGQYEQQCNAAALKRMGVTVLSNFNLKSIFKITEWLEIENTIINVDYEDEVEDIVKSILHWGMKQKIGNSSIEMIPHKDIQRENSILIKK